MLGLVKATISQKPIRSLLTYQGSKFQLIKHVWKRLPEDLECFHDVFGGGATVSINMVGRCDRVFYNELNDKVVEILEWLSSLEPQQLIDWVDAEMKKHKLSAKNVEAFNNYVAHYNKNQNPATLFLLCKHAFSGLMRFNSSGKFNYSHGKRSFAKSKERDIRIRKVLSVLPQLEVYNLDYKLYLKEVKPSKKDLIYFDPPYLASGDNTYKGSWSEDSELELLKVLDALNRMGRRWMLSNVIEHRGHENKILKKWSKKYNCYKVTAPEYKLHRGGAYEEDESGTIEVIITNY